MSKPLVSIKSETTVIGFGEPQPNDAVSVESGGLGVNYVSPNTILVGNNSLPLKPIGLNKINSSNNVSITINDDSVIGNKPIVLQVQDENLTLKNFKGVFPFGRIGPGDTDAVIEEAADDFGNYAGPEF